MSSNNNSTAIPSPEEWLESHPEAVSIIDGDFVYTAPWVEGLLQSYAAHVAALVHRNTRHLAAEITAAEGDTYDPAPIAARRAYNRIINMPLRAVYPAGAGEEKLECKRVTFYAVYDFRAMYDRSRAVCYKSLLETVEKAKKIAEGYGGGVIYEHIAEFDDTTTPHTLTEISARQKMQVIPK